VPIVADANYYKLAAGGIDSQEEMRLQLVRAHKEIEQLKQQLLQMDSNNGGVVDLAEFVAADGTEQEFVEYDRNGDGQIDEVEVAAWHNEGRE
jgi:hypothetical protein